ncbi:glycosyl transferase [Myroides sp. M-43]|uniref:glycosyltransferase family 32 protein n=1 Tax=Myroides oncorhynchi TaxID=2893756 RepID=UPI001E29616F|nr:glycosyltransferase [Myroides oncorhynchi]MCC9041870.1 glycosyl transferase [Myroides oncorhynchi]
MIPKIIHLCWFGGSKFPESVEICIASMKKHNPDYQIMIWNEENYDVNKCRFTSEAYREKKFAFVSDVCRLEVLQQYGGVYLDTDVEILKSFDPLLDNDFFLGRESLTLLCTAVIGCVPNHPLTAELLTYYSSKSFYRYPLLKSFYKKINKTPNTVIISKMLSNNGLLKDNSCQRIDKYNLVIYPTYYFSPIDYKTKVFNKSEDTYCIHHFTTTWKK